MAVKWAVANGNWGTGATWNDGVIPASNDIVYCNGHTINMTWTTIIVSELRNDADSELGIIAGGYLQLPGSNGTFNFVGDIYANGTIITTLNNALRQDIINITGNIHNSNSNYYAVVDYDTNATRNSLNINGNLYGNYCASLFYAGILVVNGSLYPADDTLPMISVGTYGERAGGATINSDINDITLVASGNATINQLRINGNAIEDINRMVYGTNVSSITNFIVNGDYTNRRTQYYTVTNFTIGGSIYYVGTNNKLGVNYTNINILQPSEFVWKDIAEPRSNPFIILTDAEMNNRQQYPSEDVVKEGVEYVWGEKVGTYQAPPESVVLKGYVYDNGDKVGSLENQNIVGCVTKEDVREGVSLLGMGEVGTLVVPSVDDVREGVVFDNGSVGTLIVQGGGDRLRIANFGYYTNSQSDTYIVDINESFKPMFATAEESVLLELFPDLDFDNIPDKYFDDLFVKYLKYRLIVEYYRGAGINSVFTPSELTTEVVNYQNVRCEYWLNLANIYLNAWDKKYPNSVKKQRILL